MTEPRMVPIEEHEAERLRQQLREAHALARAAVIKRGVKLHPRIAALRALAASGTDEVPG